MATHKLLLLPGDGIGPEVMGEVKKLITLGKEKGFLTYDDLNSTLPAKVVSSEQFSSIMTMFGEMDIEIVESADAERAPKAAESEALAASTSARPVPVAPPTGTITNPTLLQWVEGVNGGWMKAKELDQGARDLVEVGMVTQQEADAARRAVGLL